MDPFACGFDAFLVPKQRLVESVVGTFCSFGLLDAFGISTAAMQAGAYTRPLFSST
jgi:hypothetical protein